MKNNTFQAQKKRRREENSLRLNGQERRDTRVRWEMFLRRK